MSDYQRVLDKAIAEINVAKSIGVAYGYSALAQARYHINLAIDETIRHALQPEPEEKPCKPSSLAAPE